MKKMLSFMLTIAFPVLFSAQGSVMAQDMHVLPAGEYNPFYKKEEVKQVAIKAFSLKETAVTNREFLAFVKANPEWRRSKVSRLLADKNYLIHWKEDMEIGKEAFLDAPVVNVSWFAAKAYCEWKEKRLPTTSEWEYAAAGVPKGKEIKDLNEYILKWNAKPLPAELPKVKSTYQNQYGLYDMNGLIWEWTFDFNNYVGAGDSRDNTTNLKSFCGAAALNVNNPKDYSSFLRYSFRSSLKGNYCISSLGFRYAEDIKK